MSIDFSSILDLWHYAFFYRAVFVGLVIAILLSWMGTYVVLRREVIFADAISNIAFLGVALAFLFNSSVSVFILLACFFGALAVYYLQSTKILSSDSLLEILAQAGLASAVVVISLLPGYRVNLDQFLFGDLLGLSSADIWLSAVMFIVLTIIIIVAHKNFVRMALSDLLSQNVINRKKYWNLFFVILLAFSIGLAIKVVGVLLVAAFITIPANMAKILAKSLKATFFISVIVAVITTFWGIHVSALLNIPSGPSIVLLMVLFLLLSLLKLSFKR